MKIALFYYDGFSEFEVVLACLFFKEYDPLSIALEKRVYQSEGRQRFLVDQTLRDVDPASVDLLIIPGGEPAPLVGNPELKRFVEQLLAKGKKVAGICGGASILAGLGVLGGKRCTGMGSGVDPGSASSKYYAESIVLDDQVVVDGNIITAQGQAYVEFAIELARQMDLCEEEQEYLDALRWFKNIR